MVSLAHEQLKTKARELLKEKHGFNDSEIFEEFDYILKNSVKIKIDVVGKNSEKFIAVECGNTSKLKEVSMINELGKDNVILLPYDKVILEPHFYIDPKTRKDKVMLLKSVYNKYIYDKLKDDKDFGLLEYNEKNDDYFYIGKKRWIWMSFPTKRNTIVGKELQYEITFTIEYLEDNKYELTIGSQTNQSVKQFIDLSSNTKEKITEELKKLPSGFFTHDYIKFKTKNIRGPPLPRNHEINKPIPCNQMSEEMLKEVEKRVVWYLEEGKKFEEYPVISIVKTEVKKEELAKVMLILKPLYNLSFKFKTTKQETAIHDSLESLKQRVRLYELGLDKETSEEDYDRIVNAIKEIERENSL